MSLNRILAATTARPDARGFTKSSDLRWIVARMITTNSLAAFAQEVTRNRPVTEASPVRRRDPAPASGTDITAQPVAQRRLDAVPPAPSKPLPRGSLLDLRV